jgi:glucokinase
VDEKSYLGVDIGGTNIKCAQLKGGKILRRNIIKTLADKGYDISLRQIVTAISAFANRISGIGIGIAGIVDSKHGIVRYSPNMPGWHNISLARILEKKFKIPIGVLNDVNAACLGEWQFGAGKGYKDVFMLTVGTGVGGAAVCGGDLQFGANGFAGEIGHIVIKYNGRRCPCGNHGCLEQYVGANAIKRLARRLMSKRKSSMQHLDSINPKTIAREARKGDRVANEIYERIGYLLGVGITSVINLYDPEIVIISGGIARAGKILFNPVRKTVSRRVMGRKFRDFRIVPPELGDDAGILGAVYFAKGRKHRKR